MNYVYTIAFGDVYLAMAMKCLAITKHFNPDLEPTLVYGSCDGKLSGELVDKAVEKFNGALWHACPADRWEINFEKWRVDFSRPGNYLYIDADAFITGPLPDLTKTLQGREIAAAPHPHSYALCNVPLRKKTHWTYNEPAAYYVQPENRKCYYNAGVVLGTSEGMSNWASWAESARKKDLVQGFWGTSPYYDEQYFNKYVLEVIEPDKFLELDQKWNQFQKLNNKHDEFSICHLVGYGGGSGIPWMMRTLDMIMNSLGIEE